MFADIKSALIQQEMLTVQVQTGRRFAWLLSKFEVCDTYFEKWINVSLFIKKYKLVINTLENKNLLQKKDWGIQDDLIEEGYDITKAEDGSYSVNAVDEGALDIITKRLRIGSKGADEFMESQDFVGGPMDEESKMIYDALRNRKVLQHLYL